jgi:cell division protein FtsA
MVSCGTILDMKLFSRAPAQPPAAISLDIGTEFVKALLFEAENGIGRVRGVGRARQRLSDMQGGAVSDISGVITTAATAIEEAFDEAGRQASKVIVGIAGELVKGSSLSTTLTRKKPTEPITPEELNGMIAGAQQQTLDRSRRELSMETGYAEIDVQLINSAVIDVKIDGYRVANPLGFQGRQVEIGIYTSYAPTVHQGAIQTIVDSLHLDLISIATEPYAVARCFGDEDSGDISSIFIDVGGGTTDIAVVRSGGLDGTKMFALGGRVFTKRVAGSLKIPFSEAETIKLAYARGRLEAKDMKRVEAFITNDVSVWLSGVELALEEFAHSERFADNQLLPTRIYLCGGGSLLPDLKRALEDATWSASLPFAKAPEVQYIKPGDVRQVVDTTGKLGSTQDVTPMALANIALELVGYETVGGNAVSSLLRNLRS